MSPNKCLNVPATYTFQLFNNSVRIVVFNIISYSKLTVSFSAHGAIQLYFDNEINAK